MASVPEVPENIPAMKLREAQEIIKKKLAKIDIKNLTLNRNMRGGCANTQRKIRLGLYFYNPFPDGKRPFYTHEDVAQPGIRQGL